MHASPIRGSGVIDWLGVALIRVCVGIRLAEGRAEDVGVMLGLDNAEGANVGRKDVIVKAL